VTDSLRVVLAVSIFLLSGLAFTTLAARCGEHAPVLRAAGFERAHGLATAAVADARAWHALWLDTEALLVRSRRAFDRGRADDALRLAVRARREARLAVNQARLEAARYFLEHTARTIPAESGLRLAAHIRAHEGAAAYALARRLGAGAVR